MARISDVASIRVRRWTVAVTILVGLGAAVLSWSGLTALGHKAGLGHLAVLFPIVVDGAMLMGALSVLRSNVTGTTAKWGWSMTLSGAVLSVWGNVVAHDTTVIEVAIVHAIPPIALAASVEALMREIRHEIARPVSRRRRKANPAPAAQPATEEQTATPAPTAEPKATPQPQGPTLEMLRDKDSELIDWVLAQVAEGAPTTGPAAVAAGVAKSDSTARRKLAQLRDVEPSLFEPADQTSTSDTNVSTERTWPVASGQ